LEVGGKMLWKIFLDYCIIGLAVSIVRLILHKSEGLAKDSLCAFLDTILWPVVVVFFLNSFSADREKNKDND